MSRFHTVASFGIIDLSEFFPQSVAEVRITSALLNLIREELSEGAPNSREWLVEAASDLAASTISGGYETDAKVCLPLCHLLSAMASRSSPLSRRWRLMSPRNASFDTGGGIFQEILRNLW